MEQFPNRTDRSIRWSIVTLALSAPLGSLFAVLMFFSEPPGPAQPEAYLITRVALSIGIGLTIGAVCFAIAAALGVRPRCGKFSLAGIFFLLAVALYVVVLVTVAIAWVSTEWVGLLLSIAAAVLMVAFIARARHVHRAKAERR